MFLTTFLRIYKLVNSLQSGDQILDKITYVVPHHLWPLSRGCCYIRPSNSYFNFNSLMLFSLTILQWMFLEVDNYDKDNIRERLFFLYGVVCAYSVKHMWNNGIRPPAVIRSGKKKKKDSYCRDKLIICVFILMCIVFYHVFKQIYFTMLYSSPHKMTRQKDEVLMMTKTLHGCYVKFFGQQNVMFLTQEPEEGCWTDGQSQRWCRKFLNVQQTCHCCCMLSAFWRQPHEYWKYHLKKGGLFGLSHQSSKPEAAWLSIWSPFVLPWDLFCIHMWNAHKDFLKNINVCFRYNSKYSYRTWEDSWQCWSNTY